MLDKSIVDDIVNGSLGISFLEEFAVKYRVPYKSCSVNEDEYAYKLTKGKINHEYFDNYVKDIERTFALDNKPTSSSTVAQKKQNTIEFLKTSIE
ncbi:MAG: hypothetical protein IPG12_03720 [Saprospiraceae bacterium]|nr:hypothetical protein [Saprospiraceae bacterium]